LENLHQEVSRLVHFWFVRKSKSAGNKTEWKSLQCPVITISRQRGCRGVELAKMLANQLKFKILEKNLIDYMVRYIGPRCELMESLSIEQQSMLEERKQSFLTENVRHADEYIEGLFEVLQTAILQQGIILTGRGSQFFVPPGQGLRVQFLCDPEQRLQNLVEFEEMSPEEALREIETVDQERENFLRKYFADDPRSARHYDLTINLTATRMNTAIQAIITAAREQRWSVSK
jgi:cytidylate kinase